MKGDSFIKNVSTSKKYNKNICKGGGKKKLGMNHNFFFLLWPNINPLLLIRFFFSFLDPKDVSKRNIQLWKKETGTHEWENSDKIQGYFQQGLATPN